MGSSKVSLSELKNQFTGRKFGELVLHHTKAQNINQINDAIGGLEQNVHPKLKETTDKFLETIIYRFAKSKEFWTEDCGKALILYTNSSKAEARKFGLELNDDNAFDFFNLIVLTLAQKALQDSDFEKVIKNSIKKSWLF